MTKHDFKVRRDLFRKGQIERHKDFNGFKKHYDGRRKKELKIKVAIFIGALVLFLAILFRVSGQETPDQGMGHPEIEVRHTQKRL